MKTIKNAVITGTRLTTEDHGCLTSWLTLDYGGTAQGFGGIRLDSSSQSTKPQANYGGMYLRRLLDAVGQCRWEDLKGTTIRVELTNDLLNGQIIRIGHIIEDKWFDPKALAEELGA